MVVRSLSLLVNQLMVAACNLQRMPYLLSQCGGLLLLSGNHDQKALVVVNYHYRPLLREGLRKTETEEINNLN